MYIRLALLTLVSAALMPQAVFASTYWYDSVSVAAIVHPDTTVTIDEQLLFHFNGEYHQGWRTIALKDVDAVTDIAVFDSNETPLVYSPVRLEKTDPNSWGKYTVFKENGAQVVEWYYSAPEQADDWQQTWYVTYTVHGALGFYKTTDELYWNLFTDYDVPVHAVEGSVFFPGDVQKDTVVYSVYGSAEGFYTADVDVSKSTHASDYFYFYTDPNGVPFPAKAALTMVVNWPRGLVDRSHYWFTEFPRYYWGWLLGVIMVIGSTLYALGYWYALEYAPRKKYTIIPQYEPPYNLTPAMMDVVLHERATKRTWPATLIDLAVRGVLTIQEEKRSTIFKNESFGRKLQIFFVAGMVCLFFAFVGFLIWIITGSFAVWAFSPLGIVVAIMMAIFVRTYFWGYEYIITKKDSSGMAQHGYEHRFLEILFGLGGKNGEIDVCRTSVLKKNSAAQKRGAYMQMQHVMEQVCTETAEATGGYAVSFKQQKSLSAKVITPVVIPLFISISVLALVGKVSPALASKLTVALFTQSGVFVYACIVAYLLVMYRRTDARLNEKGNTLRSEILGFKMYLETAERYRLQNLTPELFERFLPYAMVFGVEKKWAKAFEFANVSVVAPVWYMGGVGGSSSFGSSGAFSVSEFSASLSSSFASAFSSSAGGAAGSGGGAGGGGGGGGGGGAS